MSDFAEFAEVRGRAAARRAIDETDSTVDATSPAMSLQSMTVASADPHGPLDRTEGSLAVSVN